MFYFFSCMLNPYCLTEKEHGRSLFSLCTLASNVLYLIKENLFYNRHLCSLKDVQASMKPKKHCMVLKAITVKYCLIGKIKRLDDIKLHILLLNHPHTLQGIFHHHKPTHVSLIHNRKETQTMGAFTLCHE